ncbi:MAG: LPS export ABC transporter periplasmic protein LptC [Verrucomicrobiales bacterium]|jgi:hypothetical protein|nr:LPS export ABC transporter periplasmic protein LptC [Verrucomicrobiales bacterium]
MKRSKYILALLTLTVTLARQSPAENPQFAIGSIIKQFELPQRNSDGKLQSTIFGKEATVMSQNRIRVRGMKIDIFNSNGEDITTKLLSPESDFWSEEKRLTTTSGVTVTQPDFTLTAMNMDWDIKNSKGVFTKQVRVVITQKESVLGDKPTPAQGGEKAKP